MTAPPELDDADVVGGDVVVAFWVVAVVVGGDVSGTLTEVVAGATAAVAGALSADVTGGAVVGTVVVTVVTVVLVAAHSCSPFLTTPSTALVSDASSESGLGC